MKKLKLLFALVLFTIITSCSKNKNVVPEVMIPEVKVDPKGKLIVTTSAAFLTSDDIYIFDIRDKNAPKQLAYDFVDGKFKLIETKELGKNTYAPIKNWPTTWANIKLIPGKSIKVLNMDNTSMYYDYIYGSTTTVAKTEDLFPFPVNWKNLNKVSGGCNFSEAYNGTTSNVMGFYFDFATSEYLYVFDEYGTKPLYYSGYKISDLLKKTNGNVDVDPIDWSKSDLVFCFNNNYGGKDVTQFVFIDLDNNSYVSFVRNKKDDPVKGADVERQTLLTTKWEPIGQLFESWPIK